jgi:penicillin-binding protein 2
LPSSTWKRGAYNEPWYTGETLIAAIGQGFMLTTPLQLAHSTAVLANRGAAFRPHLLGSVENPDSGLRERAALSALPPVELRAASHWRQIILAMTRVVHSPRGTAFRVGQDAPYQFAGKTGTAQVFSLAEDEEYDAATLDKKLHDHALFVAFAPVDTPEIVVAVVVEHGGGGSSVAAPVAREVLDSYLGPRPEAPRLARSASDEP